MISPVSTLLGIPQHHFLQPVTEDAAGWADRGHVQPIRGLQCRYQDAAGRTRFCRLAAKPMVARDGRFLGYRGTASDMTTETEAQAQVRHLSYHDTLTGLPNRAALRERLEQQLAVVRRLGEPLALLCLDLDHFKEVNDTLGHGAGDRLLQEMAERFRACVRQTDTVARHGGDEFVVLLPGVQGADEVELLCQRLLESAAAPVMLDGHQAHVGLSIGAALAPADGTEPDALMQHADIALYQAKADGRGTFRFFAAAMNERLQRRRGLELDLRRALGRGEFVLHFQPRFTSTPLQLAGLEALLRWQHPERGVIGPDQFVPLAEETGLVVPIGAWVLQEATRQIAAIPGVFVSVNLSPVQFRRGDLVATVEQALAASGLEPGRLELEITEGILLEGTERSLQVLHRLKALGVKLAMDDFGTGYSSLSYLQSFPLDRIKIDRSFVAGLGSDPDAEAIVRAVVGLGRALRMATTAEGVEAPEQVAFLRAEGCEEMQGFLLSRPAPLAELRALFGRDSGAPGERSVRLGALVSPVSPALVGAPD
jgi:diguanylate cyclase (GGDEF)-like protein